MPHTGPRQLATDKCVVKQATPLSPGRVHPKPVALALLSGGLDSTVAIRLIQEQGVEVVALNFNSPFCTCSPRKSGCHLATEVARDLGVEIRSLSKGMGFLRIVQYPKFGYGRGVNPCIDCRVYMLQKAAAVMSEVGASFIITGEVLGQRPMSQKSAALRLIERESGLEGLIVRPLSAGHLEPTIPELDGTLDREMLLSIQGRSRKPQLELARERGLSLFSCPAGGCLLTDSTIARRVLDMFLHCPDYGMTDARLSTIGRHFRLNSRLKVVLGRNEEENARLKSIGGAYPSLDLAPLPGPYLLISGELAPGDPEQLGRLMRFYAKKVRQQDVEVRLEQDGKSEPFVISGSASEEEVRRWSI